MELDGLSPFEIIQSLDIKSNIHNIFKSGEGAGKSGSFFFFSSDDKYIIKTLRGTEMQVLLNMLDDLICHLEITNNKSLLARIYGAFTIKTYAFAPVNGIIMQNTVHL